MDKKIYQSLIEQFSMYDSNELQEIINDKDSSDEAIEAAKYIISGNSIEAKNYQSEVKKHESLMKETISNPLYQDLHQLAGDIRFIKNIIIIGIIFEIINIMISLI